MASPKCSFDVEMIEDHSYHSLTLTEDELAVEKRFVVPKYVTILHS
jgi:hypothetical protein